jgi:ABC-2 type transport system permease protein
VRQLLMITASELFRLFARRRTYLGFASFAAFNALFLSLLSRPGPQNLFRRPLEYSGFVFEDYFSALTLAYSIVGFTTIFLTTLFFPLVSGDIVAKESEDGNLRLILSRPVSRFRLLASKFIACQIYSAALVLFVGISCFLCGSLLAKWNGGLFTLAPEAHLFSAFCFAEGWKRYTLGILLLMASMSTVSSVGFLFSCQKMKPSAATIITIVLFFIDAILSRIPYFEEYEHWFVTPRMAGWLEAFRYHLRWPWLVENYAFLAGLSVTCFVVGWLSFERRDLKA